MAPAQKLTPRPDQEEAIALALAQVGPDQSNGCLIGDDMGFGKTIQGAEIAARGQRDFGWTRALIVALPDTHGQWKERLALQSDGAIQARIMNGTTKEGKANLQAFLKREPGFYIAGSHYLAAQDWETKEMADGTNKRVRKHIFERATRGREIDAILFDEVQAIANRKSKTRQTIYSIKANLRVAFSGTWFLNKVENMWSVAKWLWQGRNPATDEFYVISSFSTWRERYLVSEPVRNKKGQVVRDENGKARDAVVGERNPGEFAATLPAYIRRENEDQAPEPTIVRVDPTPEQQRQIEELNRDLMTWVNGWDGDQMPLVVDLPIVLRTRLRQATIAELSIEPAIAVLEAASGPEGAMTDALRDAYDQVDERVYFADDAASAKLGALRGIVDGPWAGQPVGIYTDSKIGAHFIVERMKRAGYDARAWTGDLTRKERDELKADFIAGKFQYLVGTIQSMGTGIDGLQTACNKVAWVSKADGNSALNAQALARYFRHGRTLENGGFAQVELVMTGTVDEMTFESLIAQAWSVREAMNGGTGKKAA
ncbi:MAG: SNF2-related protein [Microbacterium gubbeenense]|uniref:SNF2-related protein n=1 Tax=Microbacterium gubbeenense TaxID=159896 RepID=UPI003F9D7109